ncbi:MAG: hypothetical protein HYV08_12245 [Deltaproteobacteria bacterium]|nr:hypothetical protein [Deltaproteobacteria bacterium]
MSADIMLGAWLATGLTLFMYSFLYRDNPLFKLGEHLYVGVSIGYTIVRLHYDVMEKKLISPVVQQGQWWLLVPALLGVLVLTRFIPRAAWLSRLSFAFIVGFGSGVAIPRIISSFILQQVQGTLRPLAAVGADGVSVFTWQTLNTLLILVGVVTVLFYFFFSVEHRGAIKVAARTGIYFLMVSFGAAFGYTVMARMSLLIGRFDDLITFSGQEFGYASPILLVVVLALLVAWERRRRRLEAGSAGGDVVGDGSSR